MGKLQDLKASSPAYAGMSDMEFASRVYRTHYAGTMSFPDFAAKVGFQQEAPIDPAEGMSLGERLAVGAGRGASGVYQGIKQLGLQAGEKIGAVAPGVAARYTRERQAEHDLYDKYAGGLGTAGKVGRFLGSATALPLPGAGAGASLGARLGSAAAMGAAQGGAEFVPEGGSRAQNLLIGGLAGAGFQGAIGEPLRVGASRLTALARGGDPSITPRAAEALAYAQRNQLPIYFDDVAGSPTARAAGVFTDDLPLIGTGGTRKRQAEQAGAAAGELVDRFATGTPGRLPDNLRDSAQRQLDRARGIKNQLYRNAFDSLNQMGEIDLPSTRALANQMIAAQRRKGTLADQSLISELERYVAAPRFDFEGWHAARSELGGTIRSRMSGENAVLSDASTNVLRALKLQMDTELGGAAAKAGPGGREAWRRADDFYKGVMPKYKRGVVADLLKSNNPDAIADRILGGKDSGGIARQVYQALDRDGRAEVRSALLERAMAKAMTVKSDGGEAFSPGVFAKELGRIEQRTAAFFKPADVTEIRGLQNYMEFIRRSGEYAANPPTGRRMIGHVATAGAAGLLGPKAAATYGAAAASSRLLMRTPAGRELLLRMGSTSPQSRQAAEVAQAINAFLQRGAAASAVDALEIDVVGGTPVSNAEFEAERARPIR